MATRVCWGWNMLRQTVQWMVICCGFLVGAIPAQAQFRFHSEALFLDRNNDGDVPVVAGPDSFNSGGNYDPQAGYRFTFGASFDEYDIEFIGSQIDDWHARATGTLANPLVFDDTANDPIVVAVPPANTLAFRNSLFDAATAFGDEDNESERLQAGAQAFIDTSSRFQDYQVNFGTNPTKYMWRFQVGWRQMRLNENHAFGVTGTFDALDTDDAAIVGDATNEANDALADGSLTGAGYTNISGAGDGFDSASSANGPDTLRIYDNSGTSNLLNGVQISGGYTLFPENLVSVDLIGRAGVYHNYSRGRIGEYLIGSGNDDSVYRRTFAGSNNGVAFSTSLGAQASVPVTDYISLIFGYEVNYIGNVALASGQYAGLVNSPIGTRHYNVRHGDTLVIHGGNVGLRVTW